MTRLFVWGIDSLDIELIERFAPRLPNFARLLEASGRIHYESTHPPDSHTAWPSIYTGMNPAEHGIVDFVDPLEKASRKASVQVDNEIIRGRTFWDVASRAGKRVCVLLPHVGYPGWEINGVMVTRDEVADDVRAMPPLPEHEDELPALMVLTGMPGGRGSLREYIERGHELIRREAAFSKRLYEREDWDLFFTYSSVADWFCHYFWGFFDPADPTHEQDNEFERVIEEMYVRYDAVLGEYLDMIGPDDRVLVVSDHGHGLRPPRVVNLNYVLRQEGWLVPRGGGGGKAPTAAFLSWGRRAAASFISKNRWSWPIAKWLIGKAPGLKDAYTRMPNVDWTSTRVFTSDQSGIKAYNYGGLVINRDLVDDGEYETLRDSVIKRMVGLTHPETGDPLVRTCIRREELYTGPFVDQYPDLVFELAGGYGAGLSIEPPLVEDASAHTISPGSHRRDTAVLLGDRPLTLPRTAPLQPMDVFTVVLDLLDLEDDRTHGLPKEASSDA